MKIANKITISFLIIAMALIAVAGSVFYTVARSNLKNAIFEHLETTAKSRAHQIETFLDMQKESITQLSQSIAIENFLRADKQDQDYIDKFNIAEKRLKRTEKACEYFYEIFVLDAKGKAVVSSYRMRIGLDRSTDDYFLEAESGPYIKDAYFSSIIEQETMAVSSPITDSETKALLGVVVGRISMSMLNKITGDRTGLGKTGELYLINRDGYMITPSCFKKNTFLILNVDNENTRECLEDFRKYGEASHAHKAFIYSDYRGVKVLGVHDHIPEMQWGVIAKIDKSEAFVPLNKIKNVFVIILLLIPVTAWLTGSFAARLITSSVTRLRKGIEIIGRGNLDYKVGTEAKDEIGQLSKAFDKMTGNLKKSTASIDDLNKEIDMRRRLEEALRQAKQEAESANLAKSEFLAGMSHEIRTPMNAIIGVTELLANTSLYDEQKEYVDMIQISADSLLGIINDVLDLSKIEAGELVLEETEFNLRDIIETTGIAMATRAHKKNIELLCHINQDVPVYISGDPVRLRQILVNLVGNAIKFTEQGEIVINMNLKEKKDGKMVLHFSVSDTGVGIPKEKQEKIFESFTQADSSTTRKYRGTGLGLTISKQLIEKMGGRIWVESEEGKGSSFNFTIHTRVVEKPEEKEDVIPMEVRHLRIMIVDDSRTNRMILRETLIAWGCLPTEAQDGASALQSLGASKKEGRAYQLILLDKNMPDMDGFETARKIKKLEGYADVPVILLTSSENKGDRKMANDLGISIVLLKPVRRSKLYGSIVGIMADTKKKKVMPEKQIIESMLKGRPLKILLAEDNLINQKLAVRLLEKQGWKTTVANNGREAVNLSEKEEFDLILMDVQMPEMDGLEATKKIRKREEHTGGHISIIALTAHAFEEDRKRCLAAGMDDYTTKPIRIKELFKTIDELLLKNT